MLPLVWGGECSGKMALLGLENGCLGPVQSRETCPRPWESLDLGGVGTDGVQERAPGLGHGWLCLLKGWSKATFGW